MSQTDTSRAELGFTAHFMMQLDIEDLETLEPMRLFGVERASLRGVGEGVARDLLPPAGMPTGAFGVGDWVLADSDGRVVRRLEPFSELKRRAAGTDRAEQIIACNLNTLFVVSSCNADFNPARLERYLALAAEARIDPVLVLTKADMSDDVDGYVDRARALMPGLEVIALNAKADDVAGQLAFWTGTGQTVALVGSSGVGKTTLLNALTGLEEVTQDIREDDAKGRHTTTARSLHRIPGRGWVIDTPGMRALRLHDVAEGVAAVFSDIEDLAEQCRFGDCAHDREPGCAVQAAIAAGDLDEKRLERWRKLAREDARNSESIAQARSRDKALGKMYAKAMNQKGRKR